MLPTLTYPGTSNLIHHPSDRVIVLVSDAMLGKFGDAEKTTINYAQICLTKTSK